MSRVGTVGLAWLAAWAAAGCSGPPADAVSGSIRFGDRVVNYGYVAFFDGDGRRVGKSVIYPDGTYHLRNPPRGELRVVVVTGEPPVAAAAGGATAGPPVKFERIEVPARYTDPAKTDLRCTVTGGQQRFDIDLKP